MGATAMKYNPDPFPVRFQFDRLYHIVILNFLLLHYEKAITIIINFPLQDVQKEKDERARMAAADGDLDSSGHAGSTGDHHHHRESSSSRGSPDPEPHSHHHTGSSSSIQQHPGLDHHGGAHPGHHGLKSPGESSSDTSSTQMTAGTPQYISNYSKCI